MFTLCVYCELSIFPHTDNHGQLGNCLKPCGLESFSKHIERNYRVVCPVGSATTTCSGTITDCLSCSICWSSCMHSGESKSHAHSGVGIYRISQRGGGGPGGGKLSQQLVYHAIM